MPATAKRPRKAAKATSKPGPIPAVMVGFMPKALRWGPRSPAGIVLGHLATGVTWELAARAAHLHPATPRRWNSRGAEALGEHEDLTTALRATPDPEARACLVFHAYAEAARGEPVINALGQIVRAGKTEWRAAAHALRVLPQASDFRERSRHEVTGEDGGPVRLDVHEDAERTILDLAEQFAAESAIDPQDPASG